MPAVEFCELVEFAFDAEDDDRVFTRWVQAGQYSISFEDFKAQLQPPRFKSDKEILTDTETIVNAMAGVKNGNI